MAGRLNNPIAYRFLNLKMVPIVMEQFNRNGIKWNIPKSTSKEFTEIKLTALIDGQRLVCSPTLTTRKAYVGISLRKMMSAKNILTICDDKIFIISIEKLHAIWSDNRYVYISKNMYTDGLGMSAEMTRIKIEYIKDNADYVFDLDEDLAEKYNKDYQIAFIEK